MLSITDEHQTLGVRPYRSRALPFSFGPVHTQFCAEKFIYMDINAGPFSPSTILLCYLSMTLLLLRPTLSVVHDPRENKSFRLKSHKATISGCEEF